MPLAEVARAPQQRDETALAWLDSPGGWHVRYWDGSQESWLRDRWDETSQTVAFRPDDTLSMTRFGKDRTACLSALSLRCRYEVLANLGIDEANGFVHTPFAIRSLVRAAAEHRSSDLCSVPRTAMAEIPKALLRRWAHRVSIGDADPAREWDRDQVRLEVVMPGAGRALLRLDRITQPWLRLMFSDVARVRSVDVGVGTLVGWAVAFARLSAFLQTLPGAGVSPNGLSRSTMDQFSSWLACHPEVTDLLAGNTLAAVCNVTAQARALGMAEKYGVPAGFAVGDPNSPAVREQVWQERGFPDATFRFLLGFDELFGERVLDLARSVTDDEFTGQVFLAALHFSANFGRRSHEVCSLQASRLRCLDEGRAELLYDNFKSGRSHVWLPIDSRSAQFAQSWIHELRDRFPGTALKDLALLPATCKNSKGSRPMPRTTLSQLWRRWVGLLEQAIVLGHLHAATDLPLDVLVRLRRRDVATANLVVEGRVVPLPAATARILADYAGDVLALCRNSRYMPDREDALVLFPNLFMRPGTLRRRSEKLTEFEPVSPHRFDALGEGWLELAGGYECGGIPGGHLGSSRIPAGRLQLRLFRHTYLQHLVNLGTDIFLVQELADHGRVDTTIDSYVRVREDKLREAVEELARHRLNTYGRPTSGEAVPIRSRGALDLRTNDCAHPQVLQLGAEGCDRDRMCFGCEHFAADPSNIPHIKAEIRTCAMTLATLQQGPHSDLKVHHVALLTARHAGWSRVLQMLEEHLDSLDAHERARVETAASVVRDFRDRYRAAGGLTGPRPGGTE